MGGIGSTSIEVIFSCILFEASTNGLSRHDDDMMQFSGNDLTAEGKSRSVKRRRWRRKVSPRIAPRAEHVGGSADRDKTGLGGKGFEIATCASTKPEEEQVNKEEEEEEGEQVNRRKLDCLSELQLQLRSYFHLRKRGEILPATLVFSHLFLQLTKLKPNLKQCIFCKVCN